MSDSDSSDVDPCVASGPNGYYDQPLNIAAVFIILLASLLGTIAPLFFQRHPRYLRYPFVIIIGKHIGTGVLLALALIHLLGPAVQTLTDACLPAAFSSDSSGYSYSPLFAMLSALLMHFIETSVLEYTIYSKQADPNSHSHSHSHSHGHGGHGVHGDGYGAGLQLTELRPKSVTLSDSDSKEYEEVGEVEQGQGKLGSRSDGAGQLTAEDEHGSESSCSYDGDAVAMKQAYQRAYDRHTKVGIITPSVAVPDSPIASAAHTLPSSAPFTALTSPISSSNHGHTHHHNHHQHHHKDYHDNDAAAANAALALESAGHSHGLLFDSGAERTIGAYILEFGLTAHSIIVGITVGVASHSDLVTLIPALTFHQFFEVPIQRSACTHNTHCHTAASIARRVLTVWLCL